MAKKGLVDLLSEAKDKLSHLDNFVESEYGFIHDINVEIAETISQIQSDVYDVKTIIEEVYTRLDDIKDEL